MVKDSSQRNESLVLVVDDIPMIRLLTRKALKKFGFVVEEICDCATILVNALGRINAQDGS